MKKTFFKGLLSILCALSFLIAVVPITVGAADSYKITYNLNGGQWITTPPENSPIFSYDTEKPYYHINDEEPYLGINDNIKRDNYNFVGWTCEKQGQNNNVTNFVIWTNWATNIELKANWEWAGDWYLALLNLDGGVLPENASDWQPWNNQYYQYYNIESNSITLPKPSKNGYTFAGWQYTENGETKTEQSVTIPTGSSFDRTYTATWVANGSAPYTVNVYYMNENGSYSETQSSAYPLLGTLNEQAIAEPRAYIKEGFTYDSGRSANSGTITADGNLVLKLYYVRNQYNIKFMNSDGSEILYSYTAYHGTNITYNGPELPKSDSVYTYTFKGWALSPSGNTVSSLGTASKDTVFYTVMDKEANKSTVTYEELTGFIRPEQNTVIIEKGADFTVELQLENEYYCVGTEKWGYTFSEMHVYYVNDNGDFEKGLFYPVDYYFTHDSPEAPVKLTIPNVDGNLHIKFCALYHSEHDFDSPDYDTVIKEATCTEKGIVRHMCYKCGKTQDEETDYSHTPGSVYQNDRNYHWHICTICGDRVGAESHSFSASSNGGAVCTVCGYVISPSKSPQQSGGTSSPYATPNIKEPYIKGDNGKSGWNSILDKITDTPEGSTVYIEMNGTTELPKDITAAIKNKNIDLVLDMGNGITWTINGLDVTNPKTVNLGVSKNTRNIPIDIINNITGESYTMQLSIAYDGDFGFTATLTIDLGTKNDGYYANLFYYNKAAKWLEFMDYSLIKNGKAEIKFTHASDYAIIVDENILGAHEDVETNAAAFADSEQLTDDSGNVPLTAVVITIPMIAVLAAVKKNRKQIK